MTAVDTAPLVRWDGLHLVLSLPLLELRLGRRLEAGGRIRALRLTGVGDGLRVAASVSWHGVDLAVRAELAEIRLRHRRLGFRVRRIRALGGVPLPRRAVERLLASFASEWVHVMSGEGIVVVDLSEWLPANLRATVVTVRAGDDALHVWLGPGSLEDIPTPRHPSLPAGQKVNEDTAGRA
jgi:hypothetical protein